MSIRLTKAELIASVPAPPAQAALVRPNTLDYTRADGTRIIRLYYTDILTLWPGGGFMINTGGYNTPTTRDRLNLFLPAPWRVSIRRGDMVLWRLDAPHAEPLLFISIAHVAPTGEVVRP